MSSHRVRHALLLLIAIVVFTPIVDAHEGPPYPLFVDRQVDGYVVSVWTDPDVGTGLFFVILGGPKAAALPSDLRVQVGVQPVSKRSLEVFYTATHEDLQGQIQYRAEVQLDAEELFQVRVRLESAQGNSETVATVEATPPGYGRWDLLVYIMPFVAIGLLWAIAMIRKIRR